MKTVIEMAMEAGGTVLAVYSPDLERFAEIVRADEAEKYKWDIHSCGPTCENKGCVAVREAVLAEREACVRVLDEMADDMAREMEPSTAIAYVRSKAAAIRARSQA
jgi:hypothetical protein